MGGRAAELGRRSPKPLMSYGQETLCNLGKSSMTKSRPDDSADFLDSPEAIEAYMAEAIESEDPALIAHALGVVARAKSMSAVARKAGFALLQL